MLQMLNRHAQEKKLLLDMQSMAEDKHEALQAAQVVDCEAEKRQKTGGQKDPRDEEWLTSELDRRLHEVEVEEKNSADASGSAVPSGSSVGSPPLKRAKVDGGDDTSFAKRVHEV